MEFTGKCPNRIAFGVEGKLLITADETRRLAREAGLPAGVLEKDYAILGCCTASTTEIQGSETSWS